MADSSQSPQQSRSGGSPQLESVTPLAGWRPDYTKPLGNRLPDSVPLVKGHLYILYGKMPDDGRYILYNPHGADHVLITSAELKQFAAFAIFRERPN
jgi:hypothetical protein